MFGLEITGGSFILTCSCTGIGRGFLFRIVKNNFHQLWIVRAWRSEDVVLYGKVGPPSSPDNQ